jgi:hypothetical protein
MISEEGANEPAPSSFDTTGATSSLTRLVSKLPGLGEEYDKKTSAFRRLVRVRVPVADMVLQKRKTVFHTTILPR